MMLSCCAGLLAPVYFKHAVDAMGTRGGAAITAAVAALLTSGLCRIVNGVAKELQHPFFTPVSQVDIPISPRHDACCCHRLE